MNSLRGILGAIRQADQKFDLFHEKDRIMIGISGGKDSMVLALAMKQYQMFSCANFTIVPAILDLGFPGFDATPIKEYFTKIGLDLKVVDSKEVYPILKAQQKDAKNLPCSICSVLIDLDFTLSRIFSIPLIRVSIASFFSPLWLSAF